MPVTPRTATALAASVLAVGLLAGCTPAPEPAPAPTQSPAVLPADRAVTADLAAADGKTFRISADYGSLTFLLEPAAYTDWVGTPENEDYVWVEPGGADEFGGGWPPSVKAYGEPGSTEVVFTQLSTGATVTFTVVTE